MHGEDTSGVTLDRELFRQRISLKALRVPTKQCHYYTKLLAKCVDLALYSAPMCVAAQRAHYAALHAHYASSLRAMYEDGHTNMGPQFTTALDACKD